jgi:hypothetical protein
LIVLVVNCVLKLRQVFRVHGGGGRCIVCVCELGKLFVLLNNCGIKPSDVVLRFGGQFGNVVRKIS